jgi:Bifunctional DNA primase/polymerase, N-terminal
MNHLGIAAVKLGEKGLRVFPITAGTKKPAIGDNLRLAAVDPLIISKWWSSLPFNIGVATGARSGVWVVDVDADKGGEETLAELVAKYGPPPPTVEVITASGRHLYFRWPADVEIRNAQLRDDLPGLDWRGEGGYVLAPPSVHPDGAIYRWAQNGATALADAPSWLLEIVTSRSAGRAATSAPRTLPKGWQELMTQDHRGSRRAAAVAKLFGHLLRKYVDPDLACAMAELFDQARNRTPLGAGEVRRICEDIATLEAERRGV